MSIHLPRLSICIPTYNRSIYLRECISSIATAMTQCLDSKKIEIVISDNCSSDDTPLVIREFINTHKNFNIHYYRNEVNIGGERNFYKVASLAKGEYIWVFGDDDKIITDGITKILSAIEAGYNLILCNYTIYAKDFLSVKKHNGLQVQKNKSIEDADQVLQEFGLHLGYISSVVIKKELFLKLPQSEYDQFVEYGFPFVYSVYYGIWNECKFLLLAEPLVCNRAGNSGNYDWYKFFVVGSSLIFNTLLKRGYSLKAVRKAKCRVIKDYIIRNILVSKRDDKSIRGIYSILYTYYKELVLFWLVLVPLLCVPARMVKYVSNIVKKTKNK